MDNFDAEAKFERAPDGTIRIMKRPEFEKPPEYGSVEWVLQQPRGEPLPTNEVDPVAVGGVLALGCSVGQGLTAFATLAFSAPVVLASIFVGAALGLRQLIRGFQPT